MATNKKQYPQFKPDPALIMIKGFAQKSAFVVTECKDLNIDLKGK